MRAFGTAGLLLALAGPAAAQGFQVPGLGQPDTPEQKRAFCQRVGAAALRCGPTLDAMALASCLIRTLPTQDSMRVAQAANAARGNPTALLGECGVGR